MGWCYYYLFEYNEIDLSTARTITVCNICKNKVTKDKDVCLKLEMERRTLMHVM